jgi:hypothetical protein
MALAELVDHVIGVDPDRDRITAAVVCSRTQGELATKVFATTARGYGQAMRWAKEAHDRGSASPVDRVHWQLRRWTCRGARNEGRVRYRVRPPQRTTVERRRQV